ncbi:MAG: hypothetical protein ACLFNR_03325 [Candidatus Paceibacterota bacterium]
MEDFKKITNSTELREGGKDPEDSEKEEKWKEWLSEVDGVVDEKGEKVDEGVKETVAAFLANDFPTSGSCEGHLQEEGSGHLYPWIQIATPEPEGMDEVDDEEREKMAMEWKTENLKQKARLMTYLEEFYKDRETPIDARLVFRNIGKYGEFRVQSFGTDLMEILSPEERKQKRELYLKEMNDLKDFLKEKFKEDLEVKS